MSRHTRSMSRLRFRTLFAAATFSSTHWERVEAYADQTASNGDRVVLYGEAVLFPEGENEPGRGKGRPYICQFSLSSTSLAVLSCSQPSRSGSR